MNRQDDALRNTIIRLSALTRAVADLACLLPPGTTNEQLQALAFLADECARTALRSVSEVI